MVRRFAISQARMASLAIFPRPSQFTIARASLAHAGARSSALSRAGGPPSFAPAVSASVLTFWASPHKGTPVSARPLGFAPLFHSAASLQGST